MNSTKTASLALICTSDGTISKVLSSLSEESPRTGRSFLSIVDPGSIQKALSMLQAVKGGEFTGQWEINILTSELPRTLYFVGAVIESEILLVGSPSDGEAERYLNELILINNEQTNTVRRVVREHQRTESAYDELTRLNNEMATLQRSLQKANHELEKLNILKNQIIGMAAHDLRGPLGAFESLSGMLLELLPDAGSEVEEILMEMQKSSRSMMTIVTDLLDVVKIETGSFELQLESIDLQQHLDDCIAAFTSGAKAKGISIHKEYAHSPVSLMADAGKFDQVINNLLSNAVKYSPHGGTIRVRIDPFEESVKISVIDEGEGISEEGKHKLFQPFGRAGSRPTGGETSTGLGLLICRRIVEEHGGRIWVESVQGEGATFSFTLP